MNKLLISYSQLIITNTDEEHSSFQWSDEDVKRGYSVQRGAVAIEAINNDESEIEVIVGSYLPSEKATVTYSLPFPVRADSIIVTSPGAVTLPFSVPKGTYQLHVEAIPLQQPTDDGLFPVRYQLYFDTNGSK
ncbi:competence protein J [Fictibacillus macauensis ZFHKF-1]|uniref:Competence protein J n=1 Tax=Fictibacillus macauensis ZFHKF-1 TaxID=1196324 RepID=I8UHV9_9BACL|nr:competence protein ComJ [Fictibacillus macauensis]EIT86418.1 competence protein J [Fictibacillus macauensis ZFHKF-1]